MSSLALKIVTNIIDFADSVFSSPHSPSLKDYAENFRIQVRSALGLEAIPHHSSPISEPITGAPKTIQPTTTNPVTGQHPEQKELIVDVGYNTQVPFPARSVQGPFVSPKSPEEHSYLRNLNSPLNHDRVKQVGTSQW